MVEGGGVVWRLGSCDSLGVFRGHAHSARLWRGVEPTFKMTQGPRADCLQNLYAAFPIPVAAALFRGRFRGVVREGCVSG